MVNPPRREKREEIARRAFIKRIALLSAATLARDSFSAEQPSKGNVIVIGAGISGLACARLLKKAGYRVNLLEARDRTGGRIWTSRVWKGIPVEMGAMWLQDVPQNPVSKLASEFSAGVIDAHPNRKAIFDTDGRQLDNDEVAEIDKLYRDLVTDLENLRRKDLPDAPLLTNIRNWINNRNLTPEQRAELAFSIREYVEIVQGADLATLSTRSSRSVEKTTSRVACFPNGFEQITDGLARGLEIRHGQIVTAIRDAGQDVEIKTTIGTFRADRVVCTLPLGVLQAAAVKFEPALTPEKLASLERLRTGLLNRCHLKFNNVVWPERIEHFGCIPSAANNWISFTNLLPFIRKPVLSGAVSGSLAAKLEAVDDERVVESMLRALVRIFGSAVAEPEFALITRWQTDPFARGCYTYMGVGATQADVNQLAAPLGRKIFFAGEHTSPLYGSVEGAYASGLRAAEEVQRS